MKIVWKCVEIVYKSTAVWRVGGDCEELRGDCVDIL